MFKKLKRLLKNEKGSPVITVILLVCALIPIVFSISYSGMIETILAKKVTTTINNVIYGGSIEYGRVNVDNKNNMYCDFSPTTIFGADATDETYVLNGAILNGGSTISKDTFASKFEDMLKRTDGYNSLWEYKIEIVKNNDDDKLYDESKPLENEYIKVTLKMILPRILNETTFGLENDEGKTGWYATNSESWEYLKKQYLDSNGKDTRSLIVIENTEYIGSCY